MVRILWEIREERLGSEIFKAVGTRRKRGNLFWQCIA